MKHQLLVLSAFLTFISLGLHGQDMREKFTMGVKGGINRSNVYDQQGEQFVANGVIGFAGGGFMNIPFGKYLGFQPEVMFTQKGYQTSGTLLASDYSYTRTTTFVDVPLQLQYKPSSYFSLLAGPQYSYLTSTTDVYRQGSVAVTQLQQQANANPRKNILGAIVGFDVTVQHFIFSARTCWDLQNNYGDGTSSITRYRNIWMQFTAGVRF
jgi:hypothetical protein